MAQKPGSITQQPQKLGAGGSGLKKGKLPLTGACAFVYVEEAEGEQKQALEPQK